MKKEDVPIFTRTSIEKGQLLGVGGCFLYQSGSYFYLKNKNYTTQYKQTKKQKKKKKKSRGVSGEDIFQYNGQTIKHESNLALIVYTTPSSRLCKKRKKKMKEK